jgi:hypothetical protein
VPESELDVQTRVLLLPDPDLHSLLHVGHRLVGFILAGFECRSGSRLARSDHSTHDGHPNDRHQ